jgi:hypothetical protein
MMLVPAVSFGFVVAVVVVLGYNVVSTNLQFPVLVVIVVAIILAVVAVMTVVD